MAMLVLPEVFERTWGRRPEPFWPQATQQVREQYPDFCFMAEVYWDLEWTLQQQGFDYTYDKRLYDRLREGHARPVREHLHAALDYQAKLARFLENHDEPRASAAFDPRRSPGRRGDHLFHPRPALLPPGTVRRPKETHFTASRSGAAGIRGQGDPGLLCVPAGDPAQAPREKRGMAAAFVPTGLGWERILGCIRRPFLAGTDGERMLIAVNYAPHPSQCYIFLPFPEIRNRSVRLADSLGSACYVREGNELLERGLYLDLQPWSYHVFTLEITP